MGVQPFRSDATSKSNISSSALDTGATLSLPPTQMSRFRSQTAKAARRQCSREPLPKPTPSWMAQTKRCIATEDVHGIRGLLPAPRGRTTKPEDIRSGEDLPNTTPRQASPPTRNKNRISRHNNKQKSEKHKQQVNRTPTTKSEVYLTDIIIEICK